MLKTSASFVLALLTVVLSIPPGFEFLTVALNPSSGRAALIEGEL
jgi:hypothetical protein